MTEKSRKEKEKEELARREAALKAFTREDWLELSITLLVRLNQARIAENHELIGKIQRLKNLVEDVIYSISSVDKPVSGAR